MSELRLLNTYSSAVEAEIVRGRLESAGVKCLTRDGNIFPHLSIFSNNQGIRIYVFEKDYEQALKMLDQGQ